MATKKTRTDQVARLVVQLVEHRDDVVVRGEAKDEEGDGVERQTAVPLEQLDPAAVGQRPPLARDRHALDEHAEHGVPAVAQSTVWRSCAMHPHT